jgi:hypothetical protein
VSRINTPLRQFHPQPGYGRTMLQGVYSWLNLRLIIHLLKLYRIALAIMSNSRVKLIKIDGQRLTFGVEADDGVDVIAKGDS